MYKNRKVLIVDDDELFRLTLSKIIYSVFPEITILLASSAFEASCILKNEIVDVILLDVRMPSVSGIDMLKTMKEETSDFKTSVIFVSAHKDADYLQQALRLDAIDYLEKPIDVNELENAIIKSMKASEHKSVLNGNVLHTKWHNLMTSQGELLVKLDDIQYFETFSRYSKVYFNDGSTKIVRENLQKLSEKLPASLFVRVSRQYIVNVESIMMVSISTKSLSLKSGAVLQPIYPFVIKKLVADFGL